MAEPWFRCHAELIEKNVVKRCAAALKITRIEAIGHLVSMWGEMSRHLPKGDLSNVDNDDIERWAHWRGRRGAFAKFIREKHAGKQRKHHINDWDEYNGRLEEIREANRVRQSNFRERQRVAREAADAELEASLHNAAVTRDVTRTDNATSRLYDNDDDKSSTTTLRTPSRARAKSRNTTTEFRRLEHALEEEAP